MRPALSPHDFVDKWRRSTLKESAAYQEHFGDLCRLVGHATPAEHDPTGASFTFQKGVTKEGGEQGFADVWYRNHFAWEYKGPHGNLDRAYQQLLQYREALENPPLLIVSDMEIIRIHSNFTDSVKRVVTITLDDLLRPEGLNFLHDVFFNPYAFKSPLTTEQATVAAAAQFGRIAELRRKYGDDPRQIAHFLIRLLFCLFAEDIGLLPKRLFSELIRRTRYNPIAFAAQLQPLFAAMATGGYFGLDEIRNFDGRLFDSNLVLPLDSDSLDLLAGVSELDWSSIEPSVFGTLFERSLDPAKRAQLGAHYTSKDDILLIVEPVLMAPLRRRWAEVKQQALELAARRDEVKGAQRTKLQGQIQALLIGFAGEIAGIRVLDAAGGSGNFLYVALKLLLDLEKEVGTFAVGLGLTRLIPTVSPEQLYGIEVNEYAYELAQATIWIGYLQWFSENGYGIRPGPILKPLNNIRRMDAILAYDDQGRPVEPEWPETDVIIGNPPFLGGNKIRQEMGDKYVEDLFALYKDRVPAFADLVCYWFEKARAQIEQGKASRAGLLATNSIRGGVNRKVLERIKETGDIFWAQSDRDWVLEGAAVNVSMVGFDAGLEKTRTLDGRTVIQINADLTAGMDLTQAQPLPENLLICFIGAKKAGAFDIDAAFAQSLLLASLNPNGRPNSDVVLPWLNGKAIVGREPQRWIIYFSEMGQEEASLYENPFEYVRREIFPERQFNNEERARIKWWQHRRPAVDMRGAVSKLKRYIATPRISKYRIFTWVPPETLPDDGIYVFARADDYFFGVLHSRPHELWALRQGTSLEDRPRYTPTTTFETFPFPWPPGQESFDDPRVQAIAQAAKELVEKRDAWLNPPDASPEVLKERTLTNLYNQRPTWLQLAHQKLDEAVLDAYGWPHELSDEEILERLLALNLERAGAK
ncbi:MAG: DNA methyltransferase [Phycisphaerae bacterium]|jgi:type II restriction/modification system DNA methylase subunit YeeA